MPGLLLSSYRSGNRAEYFAQYVLSALGVSSPVLRQEDIGIDFYCALSRTDGHRLFFDSPFVVQVGTIGSKEFRYGVSRKEATWKYKPYETEWLFNQSLPLFLGTVDQDTLTFRLYSTSTMWIAKYSYGSPAEVVLVPDANHDPAKEVLQKDLLPEGLGDRKTCHVPLFNPIVELCLTTFTENELNPARIALRKAIDTEKTNLRYRDLGVHFVQWLLDIKPNDPGIPFSVGCFYAWNSTPGHNIGKQLESLLPIVLALGQNLNAQQNIHALKGVVPTFALFDKGTLPDFIKKMIEVLEAAVVQNRAAVPLPPATQSGATGGTGLY